MASEIKIKKATLKDIRQLEDINIEAKKEQEWWIPQNANFYKKFLKNKNNEIRVALDTKEIIGFVSSEYNKKRKSLWINDIYVKKEYRKNGVAKDLTKSLLNNWKRKSNSIVLLCADRNLPIFEKLGFNKTMNFMELTKK